MPKINKWKDLPKIFKLQTEFYNKKDFVLEMMARKITIKIDSL